MRQHAFTLSASLNAPKNFAVFDCNCCDERHLKVDARQPDNEAPTLLFEFSNAVPNLSQPTRLSVIPDCGYVVASSVDSRSACSLIFRRNARNSFRISANSCASFRDCLRESSKLLVLVCVLPFILF